MKALVTFLSVSALCVGASSVMAQDSSTLPNFADLDTNMDGYLSQTELETGKDDLDAAGATTTALDDADANGDDMISRIEYQDLVTALGQDDEGQVPQDSSQVPQG